MHRNLTLTGICKKVITDPESKVFVIWGIFAFIVAYGAEFFGAFLPIDFLQDIPAMREWIGKTQYSHEATVLLSFMWISLPIATLVQTITMEKHRSLPITLKKMGAGLVFCAMIYFGLIHGLGFDYEDYRPNGFMSRMYYSTMPGMIIFLVSLFYATAFTIGMLINWLLGISNEGRK